MFNLKNKTYILISLWLAAAGVGITAVLYARLISYLQAHYFSIFSSHQYLTILGAPILFFLATLLVVKISPEAKGSGIPQVLEAIDLSKSEVAHAETSPLISLKTACIKIISTLFGIIGGASIGREGPTVQIASSLFAWVGRKMKKHQPQIDFNSYLVTGAAAGVAAAFNTPLAGITFALEEIAVGSFAQFKKPVMVGIIIAGIIAQAMAGDYLYFGQPILSPLKLSIIFESIVIALICGLLGGIFSRIISEMDFKLFPKSWQIKSLLCGFICAIFILTSKGTTAGSGYEIIRHYMDDMNGKLPLLFGIEKFFTTIFSYLSGMAGGIFSPCLSIGAGIGYSIAHLCFFSNIKACALIGMVAFFSGVVQAPLTAVVIVMEMTSQHNLILPFMVAALIAQVIGQILMPVPLYHHLAHKNSSLKVHDNSDE